jgi:AcrR family transcriptional regulator
MPLSTSEKILRSARRLLDSGGSAKVSMREVGKAVRITPMAIYRHFPDRDALLNAVADEGFSDLAEKLDRAELVGGTEERLLAICDLYLTHALANPRLFELMFLTQRAGARQYPNDFEAGRSTTVNRVASVVRSGIEAGDIKGDDPWEITFQLGALSHGLIQLYLGGRVDATPAQFRKMYREAFIRFLHGILR